MKHFPGNIRRLSNVHKADCRNKEEWMSRAGVDHGAETAALRRPMRLSSAPHMPSSTAGTIREHRAGAAPAHCQGSPHPCPSLQTIKGTVIGISFSNVATVVCLFALAWFGVTSGSAHQGLFLAQGLWSLLAMLRGPDVLLGIKPKPPACKACVTAWWGLPGALALLF